MKDKSTHFDWLMRWKCSSWGYLWSHQQWWIYNIVSEEHFIVLFSMNTKHELISQKTNPLNAE